MSRDEGGGLNADTGVDIDSMVGSDSDVRGKSEDRKCAYCRRSGVSIYGVAPEYNLGGGCKLGRASKQSRLKIGAAGTLSLYI